jgi:hypothetical protein
VIPIVYGYPAPETEEAAERGELVIYGCLVGAEDPQHACQDCRVEFDFQRPELLDADSARQGWRPWN